MPVTPVTANSVATSSWANEVATAVNTVEPDASAPANIAAAPAPGVSTRAARRDHEHPLLNGGAVAIATGSTGSIPSGDTVLVTLTWPVAWANLNYRAFPSLEL